MRKFKIAGLAFAVAFAICSLAAIARPVSVHAQSAASGPQLIITWQVPGGSAPSDYTGKVLPVAGAPMEASAAVLDNGKFADLSSQDIYWYLDGNALGGGPGAQTINFNAPGNNEIMQLQVEMPNYENGLLNTSYINMVDPQVVIVAPYPNDTFSSSSISLEAVPYFVNATDLNKLVFNWAVNGNAVSTAENPQVLNITLSGSTPAGYSVNATLGVTENNDPYFSAGNQVTLTSSGQ